MNEGNNVQSVRMKGRNSLSITTPRHSVDYAKLDGTAPLSPTKGKSNGFKSFFSRFGGKRLSLPQLAVVDSNHPPPPAIPANYQPLSPPKSTHASLQHAQRHPDIPPLFVAYPQAIKAASLAALTTSSDTIIRRSIEQKAKDKKGKLTQRSRGYSSKIEMEWTQKMFLLIPSMLLQYSGDGAVDRMPEKILQLTATSVAFASDAIPGRPYVLQVSQSANADGSPMYDEKKGISLLKLPWKTNTKTFTCSFLLVFDTAKEMDAWLGCIRIETAKLAGTYVPEKEQPKELRIPRSLSRSLSRRIDIRREEDDNFDMDGTNRFSRYSRTSLDASTSRSIATAVSSDQMVLDRLRSSRSHMSMHSTARTTIPDNSPDTSPERYSGLSRSLGRKSSTMPPSRSSMESRHHYNPHVDRVPSPSPSSFSRPSNQKRLSAQVAGLRAQSPSLVSANRASVYSNASIESYAPSQSPRRRTASGTHHKTESSTGLKSAQNAPHSRRSRPTSMVIDRQSVELQRSPGALPPGYPPSPMHNMQRRSMSTLASRTDYGPAGPPAFPPPQIPLPKLPPLDYDHIQARPKTEQQRRPGLRTSYSQNGFSNIRPVTVTNVKTLSNRHSFQGFRNREGF